MNEEIERLRTALDYDPETGLLRWTKSMVGKKRRGDIAGSREKAGYRKLICFGKTYFVHRVAWMLHYGESPPKIIDHINGVRDDNRIANLRGCTDSQNNMNRRPRRSGHGLKGVTNLPDGRFMAHVTKEGRSYYGGYFHTREAAARAYDFLAITHFGEFARLNFPDQRPTGHKESTS